MHCPSCGFDNPQGMKFCGECAAPLKNRCPSCGFDNPPRFKFCGECAAPLTEQTPAPNPSTSPAADDQKPGVRAKPAKGKSKRQKQGQAKSRKPTTGRPGPLPAQPEAPEAGWASPELQVEQGNDVRNFVDSKNSVGFLVEEVRVIWPEKL